MWLYADCIQLIGEQERQSRIKKISKILLDSSSRADRRCIVAFLKSIKARLIILIIMIFSSKHGGFLQNYVQFAFNSFWGTYCCRCRFVVYLLPSFSFHFAIIEATTPVQYIGDLI